MKTTKKKWRPKHMEDFWWIDFDGIWSWQNLNGDYKNYKGIFGVFKTFKEAQTALRKIKKFVKEEL